MSDVKSIRKLLEQTRHHDKDERFMATSDLTTELQKVEGELDLSLQTPIRNAILGQLDDNSNDVQAIAVKCLSAIVQKFRMSEVQEIVTKLGSLVVTGKSELRDIYALGIKTLIQAVPESGGAAIAQTLAEQLISGLACGEVTVGEGSQGKVRRDSKDAERSDIDRQCVCLDLLKDLLMRFGQTMENYHGKIAETILPLLEHEKPALRKRVGGTLGALVHVLTDRDFSSVMDKVIGKIGEITRRDDVLFTYIQSIGVISRNAGSRIGRYLDKIIPLLTRFCKSTDEERSEAVIELRENCLQAFESLILRCPSTITPHINDIITISLELVSFDPNFEESDDVDMDQDDGDAWDDDDNTDEWGGDYGAQSYLDEDDSGAWKVRRAAAKVISAFVKAKNESLDAFYEKICEGLVGRFKDRDVNVQLCIFGAFRDLLITSAPPAHITSARSRTSSANIAKSSASAILSAHVPRIIRAAQQILGSGGAGARGQGHGLSAEARPGVLAVLQQLVLVRRGELGKFFSDIVPSLIEATSDKNTEVRVSALTVLQELFNSHPPTSILPFMADLAPASVRCASDPNSRVRALALTFCALLARLIRPDHGDFQSSLLPLVGEMYDACLIQMQQQDIEQEVKRAAICAIAQLLAHFGDRLLTGARVGRKPLRLFVERLGNEVTREAALQGLAVVAQSPILIDTAEILENTVKMLCGFLKKHSRSLRHETALTLSALMCNSGSSLGDQLVQAMLCELAEQISDKDLYMTFLVFSLMTSIIENRPETQVPESALTGMLNFVRSPLVQGAALSSLLDLCRTILRSPGARAANITPARLRAHFARAVSEDLPKQSARAVAQCVAVVCLEAPAAEMGDVVQEFLVDVDSKQEEVASIALLCLGELGRRRDLSVPAPDLDAKLFAALSARAEDVKWAASFALGGVAAGNLERFVPKLLARIKDQPTGRTYLLLNSLKAIIAAHTDSPEARGKLKPFGDQIIPLLLSQAGSDDEGVRSMVAECLGTFARVSPDAVLPEIRRLVTDAHAATRATMVAAIKFAYAIAEEDTRGDGEYDKSSLAAPIDPEALKSTMAHVLALMDDGDLSVRRQAFLTVNALAHAHIALLADQLAGRVLPSVYGACAVRPELIREVDLGPFKHKIDDGLPLRKAAFQCLETLLEHGGNWINFVDFVRHLQQGLSDVDDIQLLTYQILIKLATWYPEELVQGLHELSTPMMAGIKAKIKEAKTGTDQERATDILRMAVRAVYVIHSIHASRANSQFTTFHARVLKTAQLAPFYREVQLEYKKGSARFCRPSA
eukprot:114251_1